MKRKADCSLRDLVGSAMNDLLVSTAQYITSGVPPNVLIARLSRDLAINSGELDDSKCLKKAKDLIEQEVKNETLVRFPSGNYLHGPKKGDTNLSTVDGDESDSILLSGDDDEDGDDYDDEDTVGKTDTDYSPTYIPKNFQKKSLKQREGRTSGRMKKSRFDLDEYVFPTIVKNLNKKSPVTVEKCKRRPGPKPKKKCPICTVYSSVDHPLGASCKTCSVRAHLSCVESEMSPKGKDVSNWMCCYCKPNTTRWICVKCEDVAGKEKGILVSCESCNVKYHKSCHSPPIQGKNIKNSVAFCCKDCTNKRSPSKSSPSKKELESSFVKDDDDNEDESNLDFTVKCYACHNKFYNSANKLKCSECKYLFHARCCRVRTIENIARLGSKRPKWKCDECSAASNVKQAANCRVVIPRLQLKTEPKSDSSDDSASFKRSPRRPKRRGRPTKSMTENFRLVQVEDDDKEEMVMSPKDRKQWWTARLRPIIVGKNQPSLGPIPDPLVPDISNWNCSNVEEYFNEYFLDTAVGKVFVEQDIDGKALKLMRRIDILKTFDGAGFKLDVIMDVIQHIKRLQLRVNDRRYIWADIF